MLGMKDAIAMSARRTLIAIGKPTFYDIDARRREDFPYKKDGDDNLNLRLRRSVSWLQRAEEFHYAGRPDPDMAFTCYWFAFNALYARDPEKRNQGERKSFKAFFETVIGYDDKCRRAILDEIQDNLSQPIRVLMNNMYAFEFFWRHYNGVHGYVNWEIDLEEDKVKMNKSLGEQDVYEILSVLFERLYVIRNQIFHGNATWNGGRNYDQLRDGANIMAFIVPQLITLVMDNPEMDLGKPYYTLPPGVSGVSPVKDN